VKKNDPLQMQTKRKKRKKKRMRDLVRGAQAHMRRAAFYSHTDSGRARWHTERARSLVAGTSFGAGALEYYKDLVTSGLTDDNIRLVLEELKGAICSGEFIPHISTWNVRGVRDMSGLFKGWVDFNEPLAWDTSHVVRFDEMFAGCTSLGQSRVGNFSAAGDWQPIAPHPNTPTLTLNFASAVSVTDMFAGCTNVHLLAEDCTRPAVFEELKTTLGTRDGHRRNRITEGQSAVRREEVLEGARERRRRNMRDDTRSRDESLDETLERRRRGIEAARERSERSRRAPQGVGAAVESLTAAQAERQRAAARVASDVAASTVPCTVCFDKQVRYVWPCGHMLCGACANGVLASNALCPSCRAPVTSDGLRQAFFFGEKIV
jgi:hypothetical protein